MKENILSTKYSSALCSYTAFQSPSKLIGTLVEKSDKNIKLDTGGSQFLNIELREDRDFVVGERVAIDRLNIKSSTFSEKKAPLALKQTELDFYADLLSDFKAEQSDQNLFALKRLSQYGIELSRENFDSYNLTKASLKKIDSSLDYDSAIKLAEQNVDLENESIQSIADQLSDISAEKEGSKLATSSKELTTEEAEEIALKLYGSRMGKDITDIIKSLHRAGASITKKNVDKIYDVFYKLNRLEGLNDSTFIDTMESGLDVSIDSLYRMKSHSEGTAAGSFGIVSAKDKTLNMKSYIATSEDSTVVKDSKALSDEDISDFLKKLNLEPSEENISIARKFIEVGLDITVENFSRLDELKAALESVSGNLDCNSAAKLASIGVDVDQDDVRLLSQSLKLLEGSDSSIPGSRSSDINPDELISLLKHGVDLKVSDISVVSPGGSGTFEHSISNISAVFRDIKVLDLNAVAIQMKRDIPMTLANLHRTQSELSASSSSDSIYISDSSEAMVSALSQNGVAPSEQNVQRISDVYRCFNNLRGELASSAVLRASSENISLENVNIAMASRYLDEYRKQSFSLKPNVQAYAKSFMESAKEISSGTDRSILLMIKQKHPLLFGELKKMDAMVKNRDQIGHKLSELESELSSDSGSSGPKLAEELKGRVGSISKSFKDAKDQMSQSHDDLEEHVRSIENSIERSGHKDDSVLKSKLREVFEKLEENKRSASENRTVQLPVYMNGQFSNLNMYFRDRKDDGSGKSSEDISAVVSIKTANMGNLNIGLVVEKKRVSVKVGLENLDYRKPLEKGVEMLESLLSDSGYSLENFEVYNDEEVDVFSDSAPALNNQFSPSGTLDIKI